MWCGGALSGWGMPFFGLFPLLVLIAVIGGAIMFARAPRRSAGPEEASGSPPASALEILNARYARGDIERDAYLQARADIGAPPGPGASA